MQADRIVVAVSGGVDSVVLLDALANNRLSELTSYQLPTTNYQLTIAHFDHGIRADSRADEVFVRGVAKKYGLPYETERVELGEDASEDEARKVRYNFLRRCCNKYKAQLMTAHHQDDLIESMLINLIRGTGWRGLAPMTQIPNPKSQILNNNQKSIIKNPNEYDTKYDIRNMGILRPLLNTPKSAIQAYAKKHNIEWREDSTNEDQNYLRNYIRHALIPQMIQKDPKVNQKLIALYNNTHQLQKEIATQLQNLTTNYQLLTTNYTVSRYNLIMLPSSVATEIIYTLFTQLDPNWHPSSLQLKRSLHFIKTGLPRKHLQVSGSLELHLTKREVQFKKS